MKGFFVVILYHVAGKNRGFFAEVGIDEVQDCFVVLRSRSVPLEEYTHHVRLPE